MSKRKDRTNLRHIFRGLQDQMEARLTFSRATVAHPGAKGSVTELEWIEMLRTYLPRRYCADSAFVIDWRGAVSDQLDVVIYDQHYSPFIIRQNGLTYIPAECVYGVIEVKQTLGKRNMEYARKKAASVRRLKRTSIPIVHAGGEHPARDPARILAGIVALDGTLSASEVERLKRAPEDTLLNFGCSLVGGTAFHLPDLHPWIKATLPHRVNVTSGPDSLVTFFVSLLTELQKIGTVPAMDILKYHSLDKSRASAMPTSTTAPENTTEAAS